VIAGSAISANRGDTILLWGKSYSIAGKCDQTRSTLDRAIVMNIEEAYRAEPDKMPASKNPLIPGYVNAILIRDEPEDNPDAVGIGIRRILSRFPEFRYVSVINRHFSLNPVSEDVQAIPRLLGLISAFVIVASLPLIALIGAMVARERYREIGLLKAMGARRRIVFLLVLAESFLLAVVGGIAGVSSAFVVLFAMNASGFLNSALQVTFRMPSIGEMGSMAGIALLVVIIIGGIAAFWPAYQSSRMNPYEAIRGEG
jgi:putative ABC transport system permease protein